MHPFRHVVSIRFTVGMLSVACFCSLLVTADDNLSFEPYPVYVVQEKAFARCGPSDEFYRTDPLRHGQELQVYAETDDGWLGIRPPEDSFCWIPAETVELDSTDETGTIIEDRTVSWIGTHLGRARTYRWQVQLAKGEPVTIIGKSEREGADGPQLWYRIVPPSGEYRWVHRDQIVSSSEELVASVRRQTKAEETELVQKDLSTKTVARSESEPKATGAQRRHPAPKKQKQAEKQAEKLAETSGPSVLESQSPIGSGLSEGWKDKELAESTGKPLAGNSSKSFGEVAKSDDSTATPVNQLAGSLASVEFLSRPRLLEIGKPPAAPRAGETAGDENWVAGAARETTMPASQAVATAAELSPVAAGRTIPGAITQPGSVVQVSGQLPNVVPQRSPVVAQALQTVNPVSPERIAQIEVEARGADIEKLSLIFSRLMASRASAAEVDPVARAARHLASISQDPLLGGRARLLAERVDQYRQVAIRRDGNVVLKNTSMSSVSAGQTLPLVGTPVIRTGATMNSAGGIGDQSFSQTGYLVQVYSARSNSPPFALTDDAGRTIAYITPSRGVNLRTHLNSKVSVTGTQGFLTGLNTPHILATQAVRSR